MFKIISSMMAFIMLFRFRQTGEDIFLIVGELNLVCVFGIALCDFIIDTMRLKLERLKEENEE